MINKVTLVGRVGRAPKVLTLQTGKLAKFSLATKIAHKDDTGQWKDETSWHNILMFGKNAEQVEGRVSTGSLIYVEGRIQYRTYETQEGKKGTTEIVTNYFRVLANNKEEDIEKQVEENEKLEKSENEDNESIEKEDEQGDDLPF